MAPVAAPGEAPGPAVVRSVGRGIAFTLVVCSAITLFLWTLDQRSPGAKLVYTFAVGLCSWGFIDGSRLLLGHVLQRQRRARGLPAGPAKVGWWSMVPLAVIGMVVGPTLGLSIGDALTGLRSPSLLNWRSADMRLTLTLTVLAASASVLCLGLMERLSSARAQADAAQRHAAENQLRLLASQLEPHMLFNTLANLRVLIALDPARAQAMLDRLIAFLRATLTASRAGAQPLQAEFDRLADYLALMDVRMGARLRTRLSLPPELAALPVPPLLLQPLVENAIKHGLEPQVGGGSIEVSARRDGARLLLRVFDDGAGLDATAGDAGTRFGLPQVRERLATLYGPAASLVLRSADGGTEALVTLPIDPTP